MANLKHFKICTSIMFYIVITITVLIQFNPQYFGKDILGNELQQKGTSGTFAPHLVWPNGKKPFLVVLKCFPYLFTMKNENFAKASKVAQKEKRMQELVDAAEQTLNHPLVKKVFIFYLDSLLIPYIKKQNLSQNYKLEFVHNTNDSLGPMFHYANEHLIGSVVMVMNADVYPRDGFELIDIERLKKEKLAYVISRHGRKEKNCDLTKQPYSNMCKKKKFIKSMDAYLYSPKKHFKEEYYKYMRYPPHYHGIENLISWVLKQEGHTVLNPCFVLKIYHNHCGVRLKHVMRRIDRDGKHYTPQPTRELHINMSYERANHGFFRGRRGHFGPS